MQSLIETRAGVRCLVIGSGSLPVVYMHGFGGDLMHWHRSARLIARRAPWCRQLLLELPGHGASDSVLPSTVATVAGCLLATLLELTGGAPPYLIGHSLGGLVALQLAGMLAVPPLGLALFNSGMSLRIHPDIVSQAERGSWNEQFLRDGFGADTELAVIDQVVAGFFAVRLEHQPLATLWKADDDVVERLNRAGVPILIGADQNDRIVSSRKSEELARTFPQAITASFPNSCHYPHLTRTTDVAAAIYRHLLTGHGNGVELGSPGIA